MPAPIKIIIDTDPGQDDAAAIMLALGSPGELDVLGITAVAGNVPVALTSRNIRVICELCNRRDVKVYAGADRPLVRQLVTAEHVHGKTGLDGPVVEEPIGLEMQRVRHFVGRTLAQATQSLLALQQHALWPQQQQRGSSSASASPPLLIFSAGLTEAFALLVCQLYPLKAHLLLPGPLYVRVMSEEMSGLPAASASAAFVLCCSLWRLARGLDQLRIFVLSNGLRQQRLLGAYHRQTGCRGAQHQLLLSRLQQERLCDHGCLHDVTGRVADSVELLLQSAIASCPASSSPLLIRPVLHCSGCEEALEASPALLSCGHLCCYGCVLRLVSDGGGSSVCFACGSELLSNELRLDTLYSQLAIQCQPPAYRRSPRLQPSCVPASGSASAYTPSSSPVTVSPLSSSEQQTPVPASPSPSLPLTVTAIIPDALAAAAAAGVAIAPVAPLALAAFARAASVAPVMPLKRKSRLSSSASLLSSQAGRVTASSAAHPRSRSSGSLSSLVPQSSVIFLGEPEVEPVKATTVMHGLYLSYRRSARRRQRRGSPDAPGLEPQQPAALYSGSSNGSSCHQCKNRKPGERLRSCSSSSDVAGQRGPCRKKFCVDCLQRSYGQEAALQADRQLLSWTCPACRLLCPCGRCKRKMESRKQKEAQRQQQPTQRRRQRKKSGAEQPQSQSRTQPLSQSLPEAEMQLLSDSSSGFEDDPDDTASDEPESQQVPHAAMTREQLLGLAASTHRLPLFTHDPQPASGTAQQLYSSSVASSLLLHSSPAPLRVQSRRLLTFSPPRLSVEQMGQLQQEQGLPTALAQSLDELRVLTLQSALSSAHTLPPIGAQLQETAGSALLQPSPPFPFPPHVVSAQLQPPQPDWEALARYLNKAAQAVAAVAAAVCPPSPSPTALSLRLSLQAQEEAQRRQANWQAVRDHLMHQQLLMQMQRQRDVLDSARRTLEAADDGGQHSPLQPHARLLQPQQLAPAAHPLPLSLTISHQTAFTPVDAAAFQAMHDCSGGSSAMRNGR